jgi:mannitol/fructose-specific phosphotransferase system IIA component (Ntr-type)
MKIIDILDKKAIVALLDPMPKEEIIKYMIELASITGEILDKEKAYQDVMEREKVLSTGIGKGFALPHAKSQYAKGFTASFVTLSKPIDYESLDMEPVRLIFFLIGPENQIAMNLKFLSKISKIVNNDDNQKQLLSMKTNEEIWNLLAQLEEGSD